MAAYPTTAVYVHPMTISADYLGARGSIGVLVLMPRISSSTPAPASSCASPRGAATICSPTGRPDSVKPQGSDSAGQHTSVIA